MIVLEITEMVSDWTERDSAEVFELQFGTKRLADIMKGLDERFIGEVVCSDLPLGYVCEDGSLLFSSEESDYVFSEYATNEMLGEHHR